MNIDITALNQSFVLLGIGMFVLFAFMGVMIIVLHSLEKVARMFEKRLGWRVVAHQSRDA